MIKLVIATLLIVLASAAGAREPYYMPNATLTPGYVQDREVAKVCTAGYSNNARNVTASTKARVYVRYGVNKDTDCVGGCKIDHLIPLAIGGANDIRNLWPHEYGAVWSVYEKTRLEVRLRKAVCKEGEDIVAAQECIRKDWTVCHSKYFPGAHEKTLKERAK